jgi:hypothetical protein
MIILPTIGLDDLLFPFNTTSVPVVNIEVNNHKMSPLAIGGGKILHKNISIHIISNDQHESEMDDIADMISFKKYACVNLLDINLVPELLDWRGMKSSSYIDYKTLLTNEANVWNRMYVLEADVVKIPTEKKNYHHTRVDLLLEIRGISE